MIETREEEMGHSDPPEGITHKWWSEGFRLLRDEDVSGLVGKLPAQIYRTVASRARRGEGTPKRTLKEIAYDVKERIGEHYARRVLRRRIAESISSAYWESLLDYEVGQRRFGTGRREVMTAIGARLGVDDANLSRWRNAQTQCNPSRVLAAQVVVVREELADIDFPVRSEIVWQAIKRTLELTLLEECLPYLERRRQSNPRTIVPELQKRGGSLASPLTKSEFVTLRKVMNSPASDDFLGCEPEFAEFREAAKHNVQPLLSRLARERVGGRPTIDDVRMVRQDLVRLVGIWGGPYILLRIGLCEGWDAKYIEHAEEYWEVLDAEAV